MHVLMCPPDYYRIEYEINPWMSRNRPADNSVAQKQWRRLYELLQRLGVEISLIEPQPGLPDMVFTANAGFVWKQKFVASNFRYQVRRGEVAHFTDWFARRDYEIVRLPEQNCFEGEGDLLMFADTLFAACPIRSSSAAHRIIAEVFQRHIRLLKLTSDWFYHLDTCLCPLNDTAAIYYPAAFDADSLNTLGDCIPTLLPVTEYEARRFACNAIVFDKNVVMNRGCPKIRRQLESLGFGVFEIPLAEFIKAGGSAKCLILNMNKTQGG